MGARGDLGEEFVERTTKFKYLGLTIQSNGEIDGNVNY